MLTASPNLGILLINRFFSEEIIFMKMENLILTTFHSISDSNRLKNKNANLLISINVN